MSRIPSLVREDNNLLLDSVSEVQLAHLLMKKDKVPRSDGFLTDFFQKNHEIIKEDLIEVVEESRSPKRVFKDLNNTFLFLTPI